ncbi:MAG: VOC family protein [Chromatiales bacterium]|nr:VOC family protein [Chromatiales bacterium]
MLWYQQDAEAWTSCSPSPRTRCRRPRSPTRTCTSSSTPAAATCWPSSSCRPSRAMGRDPNTPAWVQHIAFKVKDRADAARVPSAHLEANGVEVLGVTDHGAFHSIYFFDPNGHRVELACPDPDEAGDDEASSTRSSGRCSRSGRRTKRAPKHAAFLHEREFGQ